MSVIIMILLISILILVHEAGHFLAARMFKMKVSKFGFGLPIGPTLFETKWGDTKILIHAFLMGGYVEFPDDDKENNELPKDSPERFMNKPVYQRLVVVSAGVIANILCAFIFVFLTAALWGNLPSGKYDIFVNSITAPKNSSESIWNSGMKNGDQIVAVNGQKINNTYSLLKFIQLSKTDDGKVLQMDADKSFMALRKLNPALARNEIVPNDVAVILPQKTMLESPVRFDYKVLKGLKEHKDHNLLQLTEKQIKLRDNLKGKAFYVSGGATTMNDIANALADNSRPINITVKRDDKIIKLKPIIANKKGQIGIKLEAKEILIPTKSPKQVIVAGTKYLWENTYMLVYGLYQIFTGQIKVTELHGIVAITKVGGDIIQNNGIFSGLLLTAIISMDLAIVNFLPIPALDGGHVMFLLIEKLRGKPIDEKVLEKLGNIFFTLLILLMILVIFNDIFGLITKQY